MMKKLLFTLLLTPLFLTAQTEETTALKVEVKKQENTATEEITVKTTDTTKVVLVEKINNVEKAIEKQETKVVTESCISGNCKNGTGSMQYQTGIYEGTWQNGLRNGQGKYTWTNGDVYQGTWLNDNRHGYGEYVWHDGSKYKGNYSVGVRSGYGIYYYTNGNIYEGTWQNNLKHGIANLYFKESANIGGKYINNEYVSGTGINKENYQYSPVSSL